jgi:hypothetical protein
VRALFLLVLAGCFDGSGTGPLDPTHGATCPTEHLVVGVRSNTYDVPSQVLRFDRNLRLCRGVVLEDANSLDRVGGMSDGSELLAIDSEISRWQNGRKQWETTTPSYGALTLQGFVVGGTEYVGVLGAGASYSGASNLYLVDPSSHEVVHTWEMGVSFSHAAMAPTGQDGHLLLLHDYEGVTEQVADRGSASLGGTDLRVARAVYLGSEFQRVAIEGETIAASTGRGIMLWTPSTDLMLGPRACRWARIADQEIPSACADYEALAMVPGDPTRFITTCAEPEAGTWLVVVDLDDGCETLLDGRDLPDHTIVDVAWAGR